MRDVYAMPSCLVDVERRRRCALERETVQMDLGPLVAGGLAARDEDVSYAAAPTALARIAGRAADDADAVGMLRRGQPRQTDVALVVLEHAIHDPGVHALEIDPAIRAAAERELLEDDAPAQPFRCHGITLPVLGAWETAFPPLGGVLVDDGSGLDGPVAVGIDGSVEPCRHPRNLVALLVEDMAAIAVRLVDHIAVGVPLVGQPWLLVVLVVAVLDHTRVAEGRADDVNVVHGVGTGRVALADEQADRDVPLHALAVGLDAFDQHILGVAIKPEDGLLKTDGSDPARRETANCALQAVRLQVVVHPQPLPHVREVDGVELQSVDRPQHLDRPVGVPKVEMAKRQVIGPAFQEKYVMTPADPATPPLGVPAVQHR